MNTCRFFFFFSMVICNAEVDTKWFLALAGPSLEAQTKARSELDQEDIAKVTEVVKNLLKSEKRPRYLFALGVHAEPQQSMPTNSLAFHLRSLGRTPTQQEREVIETALMLMQTHSCRSDYPLRSINHDDKKKEWVLLFDSGVVDGAFWLYLHDKVVTWFEVQFAGTNWRVRFPAEKKR